MTDWKNTLLMIALFTVLTISVLANGRDREKPKRSHKVSNDKDKVSRGAIGALSATFYRFSAVGLTVNTNTGSHVVDRRSSAVEYKHSLTMSCPKFNSMALGFIELDWEL